MIKNYVWRGGGVPGGGLKHAGHGDWFIEMNPINNQAPGNPPKPSVYSTPFVGDLKPPPITYRQKKPMQKKPMPGQPQMPQIVPGQTTQPDTDRGPGQNDPYGNGDGPPELMSPTESSLSDNESFHTAEDWDSDIDEETFEAEAAAQNDPWAFFNQFYQPEEPAVVGPTWGVADNAQEPIMPEMRQVGRDPELVAAIADLRSGRRVPPQNGPIGTLNDDQYNPFSSSTQGKVF